jgi:hypothetical protein
LRQFRREGAVGVLRFDHLLLAKRDPREVKRFRGYLVGLTAGKFTEIAVEHEDNGSCCRREPWNATVAAIVLAVNPPTRMVMVNV